MSSTTQPGKEKHHHMSFAQTYSNVGYNLQLTNFEMFGIQPCNLRVQNCEPYLCVCAMIKPPHSSSVW